MNARPVLFLIMSLCNSFIRNIADISVGKRFERRHDISSLILNVPGGKVRSLVDCVALCARSPSCKAFCYSQSTALCHLSQPYDPIVQQYDVSDFKCYNPTGCPMTKGYVWYGARCIKGYAEKKNYTNARAICTQDGGHVYHLKTLEWDLPPIVDLRANGDENYWVGADDLDVEGQYKWSDSSVLANGSPVWRYSEPNNAAERCVVLWRYTLRLHDWSCYELSRFVCQIDV